MPNRLPGAAAAALALVLAPAPRAEPAPQTPGQTVRIANFTFGPQAIVVTAGTPVTWVNDDDIPHTVRATDKSFASRVLDTGDSFTFTFARPGEHAYFCSLHPMMTGKVTVRPG
jgi:plastocyanin